jgi:hypothetical protein
LSHGVHVAGAAYRAVMRILAGVGDLMQRTGDGRKVGYSVAERSGDAVCGLHLIRGD